MEWNKQSNEYQRHYSWSQPVTVKQTPAMKRLNTPLIYRVNHGNGRVFDFATQKEAENYISNHPELREQLAQNRDDLYFAGYLPELTVTAKKAPKSKPNNAPVKETYRRPLTPAERYYKDAGKLGMNPLGWYKHIPKSYWNSETHKNIKNANTFASLALTSPFALNIAMDTAIPWLVEQAPYFTANGWLEATQAVGNTPWWLTPQSAAFIDASLAGSATGASINDMRENGPTVSNVIGTTLGVGGLALEALPTVMEGVQGILQLKNWRPFLPYNPNRYYRIVGSAKNPQGDAILDANNTGVIRSKATGNGIRFITPDGQVHQLGKTGFDYPMFSKGRIWRGTTNGADKDFRVIRSKADTGPIKWEQSNVDFRHKGHNGIYRPSFYGQQNIAPTEYFEYWEPAKFGWKRRDFTTPPPQ